ncbi:MAG: TonB-dependent receptor [Treponema sp.]|jgi:vitamin B12 transporter|nr:TonB-dependent receptor [Treponema sp.]
MKQWQAFIVFVLLFTMNVVLLFAVDDSGSNAEDDSFDEDTLIMEGGGMTVVGTAETTQQMEVITKEDIEKRQAPDLATLLEETLDMGITRYGAYGNQTEINIRGFDTERIAILIDGVPANSPRSGEFDVSQIDLSNVERIEVIYGGSDTKYNVTGALGGVINIITRKRQEKGLRIKGGFSNTGYLPNQYNIRQSGGTVGDPQWQDLVDTQMLNLSASYGAEKYSWKLNWFGDRAANHYMYKDYFGFARRKESNEVWDTGLGFSFIRDLPQNASLLVSTDLYYADKNYPVTGTAQGFAKEYDFSLKPNILLNMPRVFHDSLSTEASLSYTWANMRYGEISRSDDQYITAVNRWVWYPTEKLTFRSGVDWRFIHVDSTEDSLRNGNNGGLYGTAEYKPIKELLFIVSVKGVTDTKQGAVIPKAGFVWQAVDWFALKNNYFRSFKFPDFDDLFYHSADGLYVGNPDLKPEDGWGADLVGEFAVTEKFSASTTVYAQWTTDSIHWVKQGSHWSPENVGTGCFIGVDLRPVLTLPVSFWIFDKLKLGLSYQYQLSWLLNDDLDFSDALRIPYMPMHIAGGSVDVSWKSRTSKAGSLLVSAHWESLRYADTLNRMELEPYCLVNITVNQRIGKKFTAFMVLRNVLNQLYTSFAEYPMPGVSLTLGGRVNIMGKP